MRSIFFVNLISKQFTQCILLMLNYKYKKLLRYLKIMTTTFNVRYRFRFTIFKSIFASVYL